MYTSRSHGYTYDIFWLGLRQVLLEHSTGAGGPTGSRLALLSLCLPYDLEPAPLIKFFMIRMLLFGSDSPYQLVRKTAQFPVVR